jgi:hypothetical protein
MKCNFAKKWNKELDTKGHLRGERFFSRIIRDERDFAVTSGYIAGNPVKVKLVKEAKEWKFGGLFHRLRGIIGLVDGLLEGGLFFPANTPPAAPPGYG